MLFRSEIDTIINSSVRLIANKESLKTKYEKIEAIRTGILGVLHAERKKLIMANVHKSNLDDIKSAMPGMSGPTVSEVYGDENMVAVHSVISETEVFETINKLRKIGAKDLLVLPIERILENK